MSRVAVIGAGVVGAACASALARAGHRVLVLARRDRSTTAVSGGHLSLASKAPGPVLELARRSLERTDAFARGREAALGYRKTGGLLLAIAPAEEASLREHAGRLAAAGVPVEWLSGREARSRWPGLSPDLRAAAFCPADGWIDPVALAEAWLDDARRHGAEALDDAPVEGFRLEGERVAGVVARGAILPAEAVVLAAGPWSAELARQAGIDTGIVPRRGVLLRARIPAEWRGRAPELPLLGADYLHAKHGAGEATVAFSFYADPDGRWTLGGSREFVGFSTAGVEAVAERIRDTAARYLPAARDAPWERPVVGFRSWTPDGLPRLGASGRPGLFLACGFEGDGVALAAAAAERVVEAVSGGDGALTGR